MINKQKEEEEEVIKVKIEEEEDDLYYLESQPIEEEEEVVVENNTDESFYLANKTFYTTCHKISRQNSPNYRKKPPYSLLENWLIHSVFSKSQQILLRFPVIHPRVMMAEGDFIYTPHQIATEYTHPNQQDYYYDQQQQQQQQHYDLDDDDIDDDDYDYYDETFVIGDEGVMVMTASAPDASHFIAEDDDDDDDIQQHSIIMDENMWMGHGKSTLHVVNPDKEVDPMYHSTVKSINNNTHFQGQLQIVREEEEEEEHFPEEQDKRLPMTPQVLEWYRSADLNPIIEEEEEEEEVDCGCSSQQQCQQHSVNDTSDSSSRTDTLHSDEKSMTQHSTDSYQSLAEIIMEEETSRLPVSYGTIDQSEQGQEISSLLHVSACFVDAAWVALDLAHRSVQEHDKKGVTGFITSVLEIWKVLFLGAETMLGWGTHRIRPQTVV